MISQAKQKKAEKLLEDTFIDYYKRDMWKVTDINGNILDRANTKSMALYLAACIEGKEEQILAI